MAHPSIKDTPKFGPFILVLMVALIEGFYCITITTNSQMHNLTFDVGSRYIFHPYNFIPLLSLWFWRAHILLVLKMYPTYGTINYILKA